MRVFAYFLRVQKVGRPGGETLKSKVSAGTLQRKEAPPAEKRGIVGGAFPPKKRQYRPAGRTLPGGYSGAARRARRYTGGGRERQEAPRSAGGDFRLWYPMYPAAERCPGHPRRRWEMILPGERKDDIP